MSDILLSVLIPTIHERLGFYFPRMLDDLYCQVGDLPVEIIAFYDNKKRTVGEKRNSLLREAQGRFVVYLDDDDRVPSDYLATVVETITQNPDADCIVYDQLCHRPDRPEPLHCRYGVELEYREKQNKWTGKPAHTMPWRRELIKELAFNNSNFGEDTDWVKRAWPLVKKQVRIDRVLYYYEFNPVISQTRQHLNGNRPRPVEPRVPTVKQRTPWVSVVLSTRNKAQILDRTLASIVCQDPGFPYEVIVVDDGSDIRSAGLSETFMVCKKHESHGHLIRYLRLENNEYRNPGIARNHGYRHAVGTILVAQSDDVLHVNADSIKLLAQIDSNMFNIASVYNWADGIQLECYTGPKNPRPLFFLGSMYRAHCYAIGGNCEEFVEPGYDDDWFSKCLIHGLGLRPKFLKSVIGYHQEHPRPDLRGPYERMREVYQRKYDRAVAGLEPWTGGPAWTYVPGHPAGSVIPSEVAMAAQPAGPRLSAGVMAQNRV